MSNTFIVVRLTATLTFLRLLHLAVTFGCAIEGYECVGSEPNGEGSEEDD